MAQVIPDPMTAIIRARNAARIGRRSAVAALAESVGRAGFSSFTRAPERQIGGRFEELEQEPAPQVVAEQGQMPNDVMSKIFDLFKFQGSQQVIPRGGQTLFSQPNRFLQDRGGSRISQRMSTGFFSGSSPIGIRH